MKYLEKRRIFPRLQVALKCYKSFEETVRRKYSLKATENARANNVQIKIKTKR